MQILSPPHPALPAIPPTLNQGSDNDRRRPPPFPPAAVPADSIPKCRARLRASTASGQRFPLRGEAFSTPHTWFPSSASSENKCRGELVRKLSGAPLIYWTAFRNVETAYPKGGGALTASGQRFPLRGEAFSAPHAWFPASASFKSHHLIAEAIAFPQDDHSE